VQHQVNLRGKKKHHDTIRNMISGSSHVLSSVSRGVTQWVYGGRLFVVSVRTNKRHHHHQGAPVFPGSSRLGLEPKTPGWLVQDRTTSPSGIWSPPRGTSGFKQSTHGLCGVISSWSFHCEHPPLTLRLGGCIILNVEVSFLRPPLPNPSAHSFTHPFHPFRALKKPQAKAGGFKRVFDSRSKA
jgi:hypothetical protein